MVGRRRENGFIGRIDGLSDKEALRWERNDYTIGIRYYKGKKGLIKRKRGNKRVK